jgi:hypothetical protein
MKEIKTNQSGGRGGRRPGAGRKPGSVTKRTQEIAAAVLSQGMTPLEYLLSVMRNENEDEARRLDAAKAAAPYIHPRLAAVEHSGNAGKPLTIQVVTGVPRE